MARRVTIGLVALFMTGCLDGGRPDADNGEDASRWGLGIEIPAQEPQRGQLLEPPSDLTRIENFFRPQSSLVNSCDPASIQLFEGDLEHQAFFWALRVVFESCSLAEYDAPEVDQDPEGAARAYPSMLSSAWGAWNQTGGQHVAIGIPRASVDAQFLARLQKETYTGLEALEYSRGKFGDYQSDGDVADLRLAVETTRSSWVKANLTLGYLTDYPWTTSGCYELPTIDAADLIASLEAINRSLADDMTVESVSTIRGAVVLSLLPQAKFYAAQGWKPGLARVATLTTWYESMAGHFDDERLPTKSEAVYLAHLFMSVNRTLTTDESVIYLDDGFQYATFSDEDVQSAVQAKALEDFKSQFGDLDCGTEQENPG